jgi:uncharacterized protein YceH (UPF0502 family)
VDQLLNDADVRVLGSLIEKQITTPDHYPLSLNALMNACNQSSNRHPIVAFDEATVSAAIDRLRRQSLVRGIQRSDSRVTKYHHLVAETMNLATREIAVMCTLMLRGPQTVGEIRTRSMRLAELENLSDVETILDMLIERGAGPLVVRLPRQPGQKEVRFAHLLSGEVAFDAPDAIASNAHAHGDAERIAALEDATIELRKEVADLRAQLEEFRKQFE